MGVIVAHSLVMSIYWLMFLICHLKCNIPQYDLISQMITRKLLKLRRYHWKI